MQNLATALADFRRYGVIDTMIVSVLTDVAIKTAQAEKDRAQMHLDALAAITKAAADVHRAGTVINLAQVIVGEA